MKKLVSLILIVICILPSCGKTVTDDDIAENLAGYETLFDESSDGTSTESEYNPTSLTDVDGIISPDHTIKDGKYYFVTKRRDKRGINGIDMITYVDLETGDSHIICQDPLCEHEEDGKCKYTEFQGIYFGSETGVIYSIRVNTIPAPLCRIDLNNDTVETVYTPKTAFSHIIGEDDGKLYFYESENQTQDRQTVTKYHLYSLDTADDTVEDLGYMPDQFVTELGNFRFVRNGEIYYTVKQDKFMKTDMRFTEQTEIFDSSFSNWFYDEKTDELYFNITDHEANTGKVYVYRNGAVEKIPLPHDDIFTFTLTNSKIYYSTYNPIHYGTSVTGGEVYDYTDGIVYAADRNDPSKSELVYDCAGEYVISDSVDNYIVIGDHLYFQEDEVLHEVDDFGNEYTYFSSAFHVNRIRVNLKTGEMTRIQFE